MHISAFLDHFIRKLAHFCIYALLGFCLCNALNQSVTKRKNGLSISLLSGCLYAISDEIHQYFVPGRSCQISDMILDSCGVLLGSLLFYTLFAVIIKRRYEKNPSTAGLHGGFCRQNDFP